MSEQVTYTMRKLTKKETMEYDIYKFNDRHPVSIETIEEAAKYSIWEGYPTYTVNLKYEEIVNEIHCIFERLGKGMDIQKGKIGHKLDTLRMGYLFNLIYLFIKQNIKNNKLISNILNCIITCIHNLPVPVTIDVERTHFFLWTKIEGQNLTVIRIMILMLTQFDIIDDLIRKESFFKLIILLNKFLYQFHFDLTFELYMKKIIEFQIDLKLQKKFENELIKHQKYHLLYDIYKLLYWYNNKQIITFIQHKIIDKISEYLPQKLKKSDTNEIQIIYSWTNWYKNFICQWMEQCLKKKKIEKYCRSLFVRDEYPIDRDEYPIVHSIFILNTIRIFIIPKIKSFMKICERCDMLLNEKRKEKNDKKMKFYYCKGCKRALYCSRKCQKRHWHLHKHNCKSMY